MEVEHVGSLRVPEIRGKAVLHEAEGSQLRSHWKRTNSKPVAMSLSRFIFTDHLGHLFFSFNHHNIIPGDITYPGQWEIQECGRHQKQHLGLPCWSSG